MEPLPSDAGMSAPVPAPPPPAEDDTPPPGGAITLTPADRSTTVHLTGEIDAAVVADESGALEAAARRGLPVDVDCSGVRFIDSSGLGALLWLANVAPEPPRLLAVPRSMRELLALTGMESAFTFGP
ncbi:STAS domain-containing protein [Actinotalea sp. K2]|uniref:STAS domain-containing protein n=1 Tax=Actinotalea sp. K2 TaxID=2939438 RepID=UPI0020183E68|nr:STAS domain-containing protein [Actinotalea sp. K2]MCL3860796.1 STAS domain-containing protein [Actinotalea sp. K2]